MESKLLQKLNERQREAAAQINGAILILAGAGSGKTRTITYRIAHMIKEIGINPHNILAVTFTNKAAKEMRERVEELVGEDAKKCMISTFHSFGVRLLRMYAEQIGYAKNFTIYDGDDQKKIIKNIIKEFNLEKENVEVRSVISLISKVKEENEDLKEIAHYNRYFSDIYLKYTNNLKENNAMDFSDILLNTYKLLQKPEILERIQDKYHYIMIDEYQDTNNLQYLLIDMIARKHGNLCVVGDENQSIYGFRGANILNILNFEKNYSNAKTIKLEENYRSTSTILNAANEVIKNNTSSKNKKLWTQNGNGELIEVLSCMSGRDEVSQIIQKIKDEKEKGKKYKDITILYRTNAQSRVFEEGFLKYGIPYKIFGGTSFYSRAEIKDIVAYLSVVVNQKDSLNLTRVLNVPKRKLGAKGIEKLISYSEEKDISLFEALNFVDEISGLSTATKEKLKEMYSIMKELIEMSSYETASFIVKTLLEKIEYYEHVKKSYDNADSRLENVEEFETSIIELENLLGNVSLSEYLENISLVSATDDLEENSDFIKLMTIHNSKGLEFPVVFLVGFENEIFPGRSTLNSPDDLEEERRLCYVALTRAEKKIYISHAGTRYLYGDEKIMTKSLFLDEIPKELCLIEKKEKLYFTKSSHSSSYDNSNSYTNNYENIYFKKKTEINTKNTINLNASTNEIVKKLGVSIGSKVKHKKFGLGVIKEITEKKLVVQFVDGNKDIAMIIADKFLTKM